MWVLWCYAQLRQHDRITEWVERMQRWEAAYMMAKAMNEPEKFVGTERDRILDEAKATTRTDAEQRDRGLRMLQALQQGKVFDA